MKPLYCRYGDLVNFELGRQKELAILIEVNDNTLIHTDEESLAHWEARPDHSRHDYIWARFLIDGIISGQRQKYTVWNHCEEAARVP